MRGFVRDGAVYRARLEAPERLGIARVVADVADLLAAEEGGPQQAAAGTPDLIDSLLLSTSEVPPPEDPAVRRLLPDASHDDDELAAEFRRLTQDELRSTKVDRLRRLLDALVEPPRTDQDDPEGPADLVVPCSEAEAVAAALTDVRLVIAERLGLSTDEDVDVLEERLHRIMSEHRPGQDAPADPTGPDGGPHHDEVWVFLATLYTALTWLQDSLVEVMLADLGPE